MKKLLLLSALAATFASAYATDFTDVFALTYDGKPIANGETVTVKEYVDWYAEYKDMDFYEPDLEAEVKILATNITDIPRLVSCEVTRIKPTVEEFPSVGSVIGNYTLCYGYSFAFGNCLMVEGNKITFNGKDAIDHDQYIEFDIHNAGFTDLRPITLQLDVWASGEDGDTETSTIFITFTHEIDTSGVDAVEADSVAEYYTISGTRVAEPQKGGLYIVRKGSNVTKIIF